MRLDLLLLKLRAKGVVLAARGSRLAIRRGWAFVRHDERAWVLANRTAVIAAVSKHDIGDPTLRSLLQRWHTVVGQSNAHFLWALHRVTGCDFDERNPTAEEIRVFDAVLDELADEMHSLAQSKFALNARRWATSARPGRGIQAKETFA